MLTAKELSNRISPILMDTSKIQEVITKTFELLTEDMGANSSDAWEHQTELLDGFLAYLVVAGYMTAKEKAELLKARK